MICPWRRLDRITLMGKRSTPQASSQADLTFLTKMRRATACLPIAVLSSASLLHPREKVQHGTKEPFQGRQHVI